MGTDARSAHADDADLFALSIAEFGAQPFSISECSGIKARHIAGEVEMLLGPLADQR